MVGIAQALQGTDTQDVIDELDKIKNSVSLDSGKMANLRKLTIDAWRDIKHPYEPKPEKASTHSPEIRAKHVFDEWQKKFGMTIGHVPDTSHGERKALVNAVIQAISEPDPKKVDGHLYSLLATGTSLNDKQIFQLRNLVHQERQTPASTQGKSNIFPQPKQYSVATSSTPTGSPEALNQMPAFKKKLHYYGISPTNSGIVSAIENTISSNINSYNRQIAKNNLVKTLTGSYGMDPLVANKVAMWATKEAMDKSAMHQQAIAFKNAKNPGSVQQYGGAIKGISHTTDQTQAKTMLMNLPTSADPHGLFKSEWVEGEQVHIYDTNDFKLTKGAPSPSWEAHQKTVQEAWRQQNLDSKDKQRFDKAANGWQGSGQWSKAPSVRKATNYIMDKVIEGPPPMTAVLGSHIERGMSMPVDDFKEFIKAFQIDKPTYIGPSGFSANRTTALSFGSMHGQSPGGDSNRVHVLLRVVPPKNGAPVKCACINRGYSYQGEQEIIIGTNRNTITRKVIKHVTQYGSKLMATYEIELEYDPSINEIITEGVDNNLLGSYGFRTQYWKGLSPETIKMLIKYNNSSIFSKEK
jgi:hypothetical protein